jgi:hypothetical protein
MSSSQPRSGSNDDTSRYVRMLVSFGTLPEWHNALTTFFVFVITTGFIIIPSSFVTVSEDGTTDLTLKVSLYVQLHFTFLPRIFNFGVDVDQSPGL